MKFSATLAVLSAAIVLGAPTGEFHHPNPPKGPHPGPHKGNGTMPTSSTTITTTYAATSVVATEAASTTTAVVATGTASAVIAVVATGTASAATAVVATGTANAASSTVAAASSTASPIVGPASSNPGATFCTGHSFTGTCSHQTAAASVCTALSADVYQLAASAGPDKGSFCYFFTGTGCDETKDLFHVAYPGVKDLSKTPVNGAANATRDFEKKLSSFFCTLV